MATVAPPTRTERRVAGRTARPTVYVFELPVRIVHWVIVLCLIVLSVTGYYIHHPFLSGTGLPGHPGFTMGKMRFVHEASGFVFVGAILFRIYWSFVGNEYVNWRALVPITKRQRQDLRDTIRFYGFLSRRAPQVNGHNPLAALAYLVLYSGFIVTCLTGLGLFAWVTQRSPWTDLFSWTWSVMSIPALRLVHFLLMFAYGAFAVHHVYSALLYDIEERNGELSSMITGYKADVLTDESVAAPASPPSPGAAPVSPSK